MKRDYDSKIPGRTVHEVASLYEAMVNRQGTTRGLKFFNAKVTAEAITSAIVLHFLSLSQAEQDAAFDRYVPVFEGMIRLEGVPQIEKPAESGAGAGAGSPEVPPIRSRQQDSAAPRKKRG